MMTFILHYKHIYPTLQSYKPCGQGMDVKRNNPFFKMGKGLRSFLEILPLYATVSLYPMCDDAKKGC